MRTKTKKAAKSSKAKSTTSSVVSIGKLSRSTDRSSIKSNTWVVFRSGGERKPLLFEGRLSRDQVRCAYSRITGVEHDSTRSRRIKNFR